VIALKGCIGFFAGGVLRNFLLSSCGIQSYHDQNGRFDRMQVNMKIY
jgi:hypothetical protein